MSKKRYRLFYCYDCETEFITESRIRKGTACCPSCGDHVRVDLLRDIWLDRVINRNRPWTTNEDEIIVDGKKLGYPYDRIAESLDGRTEKAVIRRASQLRKKGILV